MMQFDMHLGDKPLSNGNQHACKQTSKNAIRFPDSNDLAFNAYSVREQGTEVLHLQGWSKYGR